MSKLGELIVVNYDSRCFCKSGAVMCPFLGKTELNCSKCLWEEDNLTNTERVIKIIQKLEE